MGASCLSPFITNVDLAERRLNEVLIIQIDNNIFDPSQGERIKNYYLDFLEKEGVQKELQNFDSREDRLHIFLTNICKKEKVPDILLDFYK